MLEFEAIEEAEQHGQGERLASLIGDARYKALTVDHLVAMERQPTAIASAILHFLDGADR